MSTLLHLSLRAHKSTLEVLAQACVGVGCVRPRCELYGAWIKFHAPWLILRQMFFSTVLR